MKIGNDQLAAAGFVETTYDGQEGIFYTKRQQAWDMPYVREHIIDNEEVLPETEVIVEVTPDQHVQMYIRDADYAEGPFALESDEALGLLKDAGFPA
ncbi:hypothetical protein [Stutzerimonas decontaminans]|uniref:Uncharacterized protein n=1 Tax=Stutzerimonas stutzeri TaxID=316 RepID=A0A023WZR0_STUST|nr:hypothetical protein [Stutzerimonas decontaminans]AHY45250.1 hypothetical protein UIB01_22425 [Stutzerimonas decontaminans]